MGSSPRRDALAWLLALRLAAAASAAGLRSNCLEAAVYEPSERKGVKFEGQVEPLTIGSADWHSSMLMGWIIMIVAEELLGFETKWGYVYRESAEAVACLYGCEHPANAALVKDLQCGKPRNLLHVASEVWKAPTNQMTFDGLQKRFPDFVPANAGSVGYDGFEAVYIRESAREEAMRREHLPLEFYVSYSHPTIAPSSFFEDVAGIPLDGLDSCDKVPQFNGGAFENYIDKSKDDGGFRREAGGRYSAECFKAVWWLSPACRRNVSKCVPIITGGSGWLLPAILQGVTAYSVPVAVAVSLDAYYDIISRHNIAFYYWFPDSYFMHLKPKHIVWPEHSEEEYAQKIYKTQSGKVPLEMLVVQGLKDSIGGPSTERLLRVLSHMTVYSRDIMQLLEEVRVSKHSSSTTFMEELVCSWLNNNSRTVAGWIPSETDCVTGQGLVDKSSAFVFNLTEAWSCRVCGLGRSSVVSSDGQYMCRECELGRHQAEFGTTVCELCVPGEYAPARGLVECKKCPVGTFSQAKGAGTCSRCPTGFTAAAGSTDRADCICTQGFYAEEAEPEECLECMAGMTCDAGSNTLGYDQLHASQQPKVPLLRSGFWSSAVSPLSVFRCADGIRCPGGRRPGEACAPLLEGQGCAHCVEGHYWSGKECLRCAGGSRLLLATLPLAFVAGICARYALSGGTYEQWGSWQNGVSATGYIMLNHVQIMLVVQSLNLVLPPSVEGSFKVFWFWRWDFMRSVTPICHGMHSTEFQTVALTFLPLAAGVVCLLVWTVSQPCRAVRMEKDRMLNVFLSILLTFFTGIANSSFAIFMCGPNPNGKATLLQDRRITCFEGTWNSMAVFGAIAVVTWCVGFGLVLLKAIYVAPRMFHLPAVRMRWKFLFARYRPDVHWWGMVMVVKSIAASLPPTFLTSGVSQLLWVCVVHIVYLAILIFFRPWRHRVNNAADAVANMIIIVHIVVLTSVARDASVHGAKDERPPMAAIAQIMPYLLFVPAALSLIGLAYGRFSARVAERKEMDMDIMLHSVCLLQERGMAELKTWMRRLGESDFQLMMGFKDLVQTELGAKQCRSGYSLNRLNRFSMGEVERTLTAKSKGSTLSSAGSSVGPARPTQLGLAAADGAEDTEDPLERSRPAAEGADIAREPARGQHDIFACLSAKVSVATL